MTLLDTAEIYGEAAERLIGSVIAGQRSNVFVVSKVWPSHATPTGIRQGCATSLSRLGTDYLDLYLLHWRERLSDLRAVVVPLKACAGRGASGGEAWATNQVRYNLVDRSAGHDVLPWCERHSLPIMAYPPLGRTGDLLRNPTLIRVAERRQVGPAAIALAWTICGGHVISIPESGSSTHVRENAAAFLLRLTDGDLFALNGASPG